MADLATGTQNASGVSGIGQDIKSESKCECAGEPANDGSLPAKLANDLDQIRFSRTCIIRIQVLYILVVATEVLKCLGCTALPFSTFSSHTCARPDKGCHF